MRLLSMLCFSALLSLTVQAQQIVQKDLTDCVHGLNNYTSDRTLIPVTDVIGQGQLPNQKYQHVIAVIKDKKGKEAVAVMATNGAYLLTKSQSGSYVLMGKENEGKCYRTNNPGYDCENLPLGFTISPISKDKRYAFDVKTDRAFFEENPLDTNFREMALGERLETTAQVLKNQMDSVLNQLGTKGMTKEKQIPDMQTTIPKCQSVMKSLRSWEATLKSEKPKEAEELEARGVVDDTQKKLDELDRRFSPKKVQGTATSDTPIAKPTSKPVKANR